MDENVVITEEDFDIEEMKDDMLKESDGAVVVFNGVVRGENKGLDVEEMKVERYEDMTEKEMVKVRDEAINNFKVRDVKIVHRYGELEVGDNIVGIVVTAPHREAAFDACKYSIDRLKEIVPLWKKEVTCEGEEGWVEGEE